MRLDEFGEDAGWTTAYSWAANAHRQTRGTTVLLTYEGWGHGVYGRTTCVDTAVDTYLVTLKTPERNTRCAAVEQATATGETR